MNEKKRVLYLFSVAFFVAFFVSAIILMALPFSSALRFGSPAPDYEKTREIVYTYYPTSYFDFNANLGYARFSHILTVFFSSAWIVSIIYCIASKFFWCKKDKPQLVFASLSSLASILSIHIYAPLSIVIAIFLLTSTSIQFLLRYTN